MTIIPKAPLKNSINRLILDFKNRPILGKKKAPKGSEA
jgi:hypothetical protein